MYYNELVKVERYVNQTYNCSMSLLDGFDEEVTIMVNISNKISGREFEYFVGYDKKDEKVVSVCCSNQKSLKDDEFDLAYTMIDLLNQEIIKTVKFMLEILN